MHTLPTAAEIETEARTAGLSILEMCRRSGTAPSSFVRWKQGVSYPTVNTVSKWQETIQEARKPTARKQTS